MEYLSMYKGFDSLFEASRNGLPVNLNTIPVPPQDKVLASDADLAFEVVSAEVCVAPGRALSGDAAVTYAKLDEDLIGKIKMCAQTREHFKAVGDVASCNRYEQFILDTKKDLDAVRATCKRGDDLPRFRYLPREFTIVQCNTDLDDSDCEMNILRGINYNVDNPSEVDTYVKIEFLYPSDNALQDK